MIYYQRTHKLRNCHYLSLRIPDAKYTVVIVKAQKLREEIDRPENKGRLAPCTVFYEREGKALSLTVTWSPPPIDTEEEVRQVVALVEERFGCNVKPEPARGKVRRGKKQVYVPSDTGLDLGPAIHDRSQKSLRPYE